MSSSDTSTRFAASPSGNEGVPRRDPRDRTAEATFDECRHDTFANAALVTSLVDHDHPADVRGVGEEVRNRQGDEPAQVEHPTR